MSKAKSPMRGNSYQEQEVELDDYGNEIVVEQKTDQKVVAVSKKIEKIQNIAPGK